MTFAYRILAAAFLLSFALLHAQPKARRVTASSTVPAIFFSDIHLDPFSDPAKVPQLVAAPASEWGAILASPDTPTRAADYAALAAACNENGVDTSGHLWQSILAALGANSRGVRFAVFTGDILAHSYECKYRKSAPKSAEDDYFAFTVKTVQYVVSSIRSALPGIPVYSIPGNNDSACLDYHLDASGDKFLAAVGPILASTLPAADRASAAAGLAAAGHYSALLPGTIPRTRIVAMDDLYFSPRYGSCGGPPDPSVAGKQLEWLNDQLSQARARHERVWFVSHIPPGVNLYASARKLMASCSVASLTPFLASDSLATALAENTDIVKLALFGHTHSDEIRLLSPSDLVPAGAAVGHPQTAGVPVKVISALTPINGLPSFIVGRVRPSTATLVDYTVISASDKTGVGTIWAPSYTYSTRYHKHAFDSASLRSLIDQLHADRTLATSASQAYVGSYAKNVPTPFLELAWGPYTCAMSHTSAAGFISCACGGN